MQRSIREWMDRRADRVLTPVAKVLPERFFLAGGVFTKTVRDLDVFPCGDEPFGIDDSVSGISEISSTRNATTWKYKNVVIQACNYKFGSLSELIQNFDFAHISVGVQCRNRNGRISISDRFYTDDYVTSHVMMDSWYTGSEYPLSSLIRAGKYHARVEMSRGQMIASKIAIVADIVSRGFDDYEDFKDQLDAVDLGLVPEELEQMGMCDAQRLFDALKVKVD